MMNFEEKKEYLKKYRVQLAKIRRISEMKRLSPEKAEQYNNEIAAARNLRDSIERQIDAVDGSILSEILSQKYICGKSFEDIALSVSYSKRQIERLHLKAVEKFCPV